MSITQTVEIPASHRLTIDVPREIPAGPTILTFTPVNTSESITEKLNSYYKDHDSNLTADIKAANHNLLKKEDW